ncbi:putative ribonuclease H-like domain-containing protein [Tanacetum coccineum]
MTKNVTEHVARIEAIRLFLVYASFMNFIVYQMDVKSAFLNGTIEEEVYVCQPLGFEDPEFPNKVYKVENALYGLHQAPKAWYETLSTYLLENGFRRGTIDKTLFIKKDKNDILLVQVYVDDIIFGFTKKFLCAEFEQMMHKRFQMSFIRELTFFLGLQVKQKDDGIFISQDKYVADILKKFDLAIVKTANTPMKTNKALLKDEEATNVDRIFRYLKGHPKLGLWYPRDSPFDLEAFSDSDYVGASLDRKSTTRGCQFLRRRLISWQCKKQTIVANSTTEADHVSAANCCGQVLWIQNQLLDYGYNFMNTKIYIDNESTICIVKNPVFHSKTKHIEIRHYFIMDSYEKRLIQVIKIYTDQNVADLLTKEDRMKRAATTASSLEAKQDNGNITRTQSMATLNESFPQGTNSCSGPRCQDTILGLQKLKFDLRLHLNKSYDPPLSRVNILRSGEDSIKLKELMEFCTKLSVRALDVVNAGVSMLMLLSINLLLPVLVYAARHSLTAFWTTAKAKTVNGERQIQALVDKNKVIITEKSVRSNLMLEDAKGTEYSTAPTDSYSTSIITQPSSSKPQKKKFKRKQRKDSGPTEPIPEEATNEEPISTPSYDPPQSGLKRLRKVGSASRVESSNDVSLGDQEDASKQGRKIVDLDADAEVTLIDETQERYNEEMLFDVQDDLQGEEVFAEKEVAEKEVSATDPVTTAGEVVTTVSATTTVDELTLAQTLIKIKAAKPKTVTTAATTITTVVVSTRPKAKAIVFHDQEEQASAFTPIISSSQLPQAKDKGKGKMVELEKPLNKKDQIALDEELALRLHVEEQAELEKERVAQEEASRAAIIKELDSIQAMIEADEQLAARLQAEEQEQFSIEEKSIMLVEMIAERKKFFAAQRAAEQRSKPTTKTQIRNRMYAYLKNMGGYKHNQLKGRSYEEIQKIFDKAYKQVNSFVPMDSKVAKSSETRTEGSSKRAGDELESDKSKKQKIDEHVEAEKDDDQEEAEMKRHIEIVKDDKVVIDAIPLAAKPLMIIEYKINKDGRMGYFKLIRANRSSKRYSSMIKKLQDIDREDLETLWKLVKSKHGNTRPEEYYERVLWGDLKVMFEPDIKSEIWRNLQGYKVTIWNLFDTCGVHFVRFKNLHIFMLVEKRYPLTPITITNMLNKKLQTDHWNEICYQLLKLMTKHEKGQ